MILRTLAGGVRRLGNRWRGLVRGDRARAALREAATPAAPMSITRLPDCSLLKVSGVVDRSMAESFGQALRQTVSFSSMPVVVDLRDVDFLHSRAIARLMKVWKRAHDAGLLVEVVVDARSAQFLKA
ncbi:MAG TPA: hypothetical protein VHL54_02290 [Actinomycetota bacterium]|nr:hypothetical protein [Actinomycetota bacterium]